MIAVRDSGGTIRTAVDFWYQDAGGVKRRAKQIWVKVADGSYQQVFASAQATFAVTTSASFEGSSNSASVGQGGVGASSFDLPFFVYASGGSGSYTYGWQRISVGPYPATATGTDTSSLTLHAAWPLDANLFYTERWRATATDSSGATGSADITVYFEVAPGH